MEQKDISVLVGSIFIISLSGFTITRETHFWVCECLQTEEGRPILSVGGIMV